MRHIGFTQRWDKLLDWFEFEVCRWLARHERAVVLALSLVCLLLIVGVAHVRAQGKEQAFVAIPLETLEAVAARIEKLERENTDLRERCAAGARGT